MLWLIEILLAIDKAKAVLPIPGLAAIIIKSLSCHPEVNLSILLKPEGTPLSPCLFDIDSILFLAWITKFWAVSEDFLIFPWVTS